MAAASGLSDSPIGRIWKAHGLKPHLSRTFKLSNDRQCAEKLEAIVGLYLNPPEHAVVVSCNEKKAGFRRWIAPNPDCPSSRGVRPR